MAKKSKWKVKRVKDNQALITLPKGMVFTGEKLDIEDIIEVIRRHGVIEKGEVSRKGDTVVVKCCGGNTALA